VGVFRDSQSSSLLALPIHDNENALDVEVVDIVEFIRGLPSPPTIVKMDIEGAEAECLEAILDAGCHQSVGIILVETHELASSDIAVASTVSASRSSTRTSRTLIWVGFDRRLFRHDRVKRARFILNGLSPHPEKPFANGSNPCS
jgi:hypothetical protein